MKKTGITRKQAIKKMGKYAALTAIGTFAILNPKKAQASSAPPIHGGVIKKLFFNKISAFNVFIIVNLNNIVASL